MNDILIHTSVPDPDFRLQRQSIILVIGDRNTRTIRLIESQGFEVREIMPTAEGLARLREIRAKTANRNQLLLLSFHPEDLAARHSWLSFWKERNEIQGIPAILITEMEQGDPVEWGTNWKVQEVIPGEMNGEDVIKRLNQMIDLQDLIAKKRKEVIAEKQYKTPLVKRIFDIAVAGTALLMLSPLLLMVIALIKLESKGPIFYISKRVGSGYQVFDFYKFRSMRQHADLMVKDLMHLNQYASEEEMDETGMLSDQGFEDLDELHPEMLISDETMVDEQIFRTKKRRKAENTFFKIEKDPRITKVGQFIRNTSIDELPQLLNVLKGDMSVVGNRPLPLYEAEQLTTDEYTERFNAPAGITGLWQVTERGKSGVSNDSRKRLDVEYAQEYTVWLDVKILLMTLPAMFQKSDV